MLSSSQGGFIVGRENIKSRWENMDPITKVILVLESVPMVLTQPGTPVSFRGMFIHSLFDFQKLRNFRCFPFPENSGTPTFPISGNSGLRRFFVISHSFMYFIFHLWLRSSPLFHVLFSFMYSGLLSVPGTYLSHSLVYKHLYSIARIPELRLLFSIPLV